MKENTAGHKYDEEELIINVSIPRCLFHFFLEVNHHVAFPKSSWKQQKHYFRVASFGAVEANGLRE